MSTRLRITFMFSIALLCAGITQPARAQSPARQAPAGPLVRRAYQVGDLVVPEPGGDITLRTDGKVWSASRAGQDGSAGGALGRTLQDRLMKLIATTVAPETWSECGGRATMDYFPLGMSLVINQTAENHERIAELLQKLRRQQPSEVALEVRFITVAGPVYERLNLGLQTGTPNPPWDDPQWFYHADLVADHFGVFQPDDSLSHALNDLTNRASPPGLTFIDDCQVNKLLHAAQTDRATNVVQAPRLTMTDGQNSTIDLSDQQYFVTGLDCVDCDGQTMWNPRNQPVRLGWQVGVQPTVSADRRFVRLRLKVNHAELAVTPVPMMPVTTFVRPVFEGGAVGQPVPFTQYVQQPKVNHQFIEETVCVPDGQTVVLDGGPTAHVDHEEWCPPILRDVPLLAPLFKSVISRRTTARTLVLVTPRIVVNEEEEARVLTACPQPVPSAVAASPVAASEVLQAGYVDLVAPQKTECSADGPPVKVVHAPVPVMPAVCPGTCASPCSQPPDEAAILRALPRVGRGVPGVFQQFRDDVQVVTERLADTVDAPRYYPLVGPAQLHHCHWKCTVYCRETIEGGYPFAFRCSRPRVEVVYIDKDHLHLYTDAAQAAAKPQAEDASSESCEAALAAPCKSCQKAKVAHLLEEYEHACAEGQFDAAARLAVQALAIDPACFSKAHHAGSCCTQAKKSIP